jgi:hAT family C-terminal dimerisation region
MAMDYLPVQATSVPCERVFSSAKETDTNKRNRMSPMLMEALQLLKFSLKKERLDFMKGWSASEADMVGESQPQPADDLGMLLTGDDVNNAVDNLLNTFSYYEGDSD